MELSRQLDEARRNLGDANSRLAARTFIDDLTHLGNRRALDRRLSDWERASPETYLPLQALLFRLENHQRIRELYGPKAGDGVLTHVAAVLDQQSRPGDFVVRYGCNEFLLLLRRCPADTARQRAEAIRTAILERRPLVEGRPLPLELSVGLAGSESPLSGPAFTQLLEAATRAFEAPRPAPQPEQGA